MSERERPEESLTEAHAELERQAEAGAEELLEANRLLRLEIEERKRAEVALRESEERLALVVEGSQLGYWDWNIQTGEVQRNERWAEMLGYTLPEIELSVKQWTDLHHPDDKAAAWESIEAHLEGRTAMHRAVYRMRAKDGQYRWILDCARVVQRDARGRPLRMSGTHTDITEQKKTEELRRSLETQVQQAQKLESLGVLAGGIAHDFNNLLTGILGNADLALHDLPPHSPVKPLIRDVLKASRQAAELTNQMLAYSGKGHFVIEALDLNDLVMKMASLLESSISKKVRLRYELADDLPAVMADASQLRQIVMNLTRNASDGCGERGGLVTVRTRATECDRAFLDEVRVDEELPAGSYVSFEVSDTGCGMNEETKARIFEPFFTTKPSGRGLGMAAVQGIVRGHKGAIVVETELGVGTTFRLLFPALDLPVDPSEERVEREDEWRGSGTVLVVDDVDIVRSLATAMLKRLGFTVLVASDGAEAVEIFRERHDEIDCVLLDLKMPQMGGEETFEELSEIQSDVPVILSSGYSEKESTKQFEGTGLAGFIQKPYGVANLRDKLREVLGD